MSFARPVSRNPWPVVKMPPPKKRQKLRQRNIKKHINEKRKADFGQ